MIPFINARAAKGPHLARWMMFVDGEGLAMRGRELLRSRKMDPKVGAHFEPDTFLWLPTMRGVPQSQRRQIFSPLHELALEEYAIRWHYYTAVQGDDVKLESVRDRLHALGFDARVFKKAPKMKSKGVDITLARDLLGDRSATPG